MNAVEEQVKPIEKDAASSARQPWNLWMRQTLAIMRLETRKNFWGRRALLIYVLAALPVFLLTALAVFKPPANEWSNINGIGTVYAVFYGGLLLRTLVFFGCAWIFMNLFRGEMVDRSLHYYFLSPVRREVLVVGKYLSGMAAAIILFGAATILTYLLIYLPHFPAEAGRFMLEGPGLSRLLTYTCVTALACIGYGAVFLFVGLFFRNPIIPALILYGWEWINFLLPPLLKKVSVIHYLDSLAPIHISEGAFAIVAEPTPAYISVPSLLVFTALVLLLASWRIRRMEISYAGE